MQRKKVREMNRVMWVVIVLAALYALVCLAAYLAQSKLVWFPGPPTGATPRERGLTFDEWKLATPDGAVVHAWRLRATDAVGAVILCHGNAGNIESRLEKAAVLMQAGFDVVLFDYRGYGSSTGSISEEGTYVDAETVWTELTRSGVAPEQIALFGESLGGAVAIELAQRRRVGAVVVEDTFTSLADMASTVYPWLPARLILRIRYDSRAKVRTLDAPLLVIHSPQDELVPFAQGRALFEAAREPKQFLATAGGHNGPGFVARADWTATVHEFLRRHATRR
ncbi:MAG: alpha/beta hydrolase [Planctomycetes bacterium]|nr:alpha/beta hydrolase [Planctomycetota bacterium]